jgi:hypothetical protein
MPPIDEPSLGVADKVGTTSQGDSAWVGLPGCAALAEAQNVHNANNPARRQCVRTRCADRRTVGAFSVLMATGCACCRDLKKKGCVSMCMCRGKGRERQRKKNRRLRLRSLRAGPRRRHIVNLRSKLTRRGSQSCQRGAIRMAPSRRMVSPLSIEFSKICCTS